MSRICRPDEEPSSAIRSAAKIAIQNAIPSALFLSITLIDADVLPPTAGEKRQAVSLCCIDRPPHLSRHLEIKDLEDVGLEARVDALKVLHRQGRERASLVLGQLDACTAEQEGQSFRVQRRRVGIEGTTQEGRAFRVCRRGGLGDVHEASRAH